MNEEPEMKPEEMTETSPDIMPKRPLPETAENTDAPAESPTKEQPAEKAEEAPTETTEEAPAETEEKAPEGKPARKRDIGGMLLDTLLVLMLAGALGGGCWYLNKELAKYRVPSPMETAAKENIELCEQREALQAAAYQADEQLHKRRRLSALAQRSTELKQQIEEKKHAIETHHQKVLAVQHDIRQEDKSFRTVAKGLLPGMAIGDAATTTGKTYRNAVIRRLEGGRITLRMPEGQTTFPVNTLVKENLPDFARYAFGLDDMVDMSDFEVTAEQPKPKARKGKLISPKAPASAEDNAVKDYDPAAGAPVVDTDANKTTTWTGEGEDTPGEPAPADTWKAPEGELPFGAP